MEQVLGCGTIPNTVARALAVAAEMVECSVLCTGFMEYIVGPAYDVCGDLLELLLAGPSSQGEAGLRVWAGPLSENRSHWKTRNGER